MTYTPIDNDEDTLDFDVAKIEQMEVEFETCPHCKGIGSIYNGIIYCWCPKCAGTGEVEVKRNVD